MSSPKISPANTPSSGTSPVTDGPLIDSITSQTKINSEKKLNYEDLFDSGYNSNIQSKTFLDLDNENNKDQSYNIASRSLIINNQNPNQSRQTKLTDQTSLQQWTDSGVCITDSGLSIQEDDILDTSVLSDVKIEEQVTKTANKNDNNDDNDQENQNILEKWLKHNSDGETLLHLAIIEGLEEVACSIIDNMPHNSEMLNSYNYLYQNPLHLAVLKRQSNVVRKLILNECSLTFQDNLGNTALHIACKYFLHDIIHIILSTAHSNIINKCLLIKNFDGDTCLHLAAYNNDLKSIELLIKSGADIDIQEGKSGKTILHWAIENLQVQLVNYCLFKCQANIQCETFAGKTPLHYLLKVSSNDYSTIISNGNTNSFNIQQKIDKIIKISLEYCKERKVYLDGLNHNNNSNLHVHSDDDTDDDD